MGLFHPKLIKISEIPIEISIVKNLNINYKINCKPSDKFHDSEECLTKKQNLITIDKFIYLRKNSSNEKW